MSLPFGDYGALSPDDYNALVEFASDPENYNETLLGYLQAFTAQTIEGTPYYVISADSNAYTEVFNFIIDEFDGMEFYLFSYQKSNWIIGG